MRETLAAIANDASDYLALPLHTADESAFAREPACTFFVSNGASPQRLGARYPRKFFLHRIHTPKGFR